VNIGTQQEGRTAGPAGPDFLNTAPRQHIFAVSGKSNFLSVSGIYLYRITSGSEYTETKRMRLLK